MSDTTAAPHAKKKRNYTPEGLAKIRAAARKRSADPDWRAKRREISQRFFREHPEVRERHSRLVTHANYLSWESPTVRKKRINAIKAAWTEEKRAEHAKRCKPPMKDASPERKAKHRRGIRLYWMKRKGVLPI